MLVLLIAFFLGSTVGLLAAYGTVRLVRRQARARLADEGLAARRAATSHRRRFSGDTRYACALGGAR